MAIYEITHDRFESLQTTGFAAVGLSERGDLQRLLRSQIDVIAPGVLVIAEEFGEWEDSRRRIDLLGLDPDGTLVVIELKRTEDGGHMELQALRYAAMVSKMTFEKVIDVFERHLSDDSGTEGARERLLNFLGWDVPDEEKFAQDVRIVLASAEFSRELTSTVLWLSERGLDIRCVRLRPYTDGTRTFVDVQQVLPLPEAADYFVSLREKREEERQSRRREREWSGLWFVNVGMNADENEASAQRYHRNWQHCRRLGYLAAGGGPKYSGPLRKLKPGAQVAAYQKGRGYVGYGEVIQEAAPVHELRLANGRTIEEELGIVGRNEALPLEKWEYAVGIRWSKTVPLDQAQKFVGAFANQNIVCQLRDEQTVKFLRQAFDIPE